MKKETMARLYGEFERLVKTESGVEFWLARDLQGLLGYANWQNFVEVIAKAITACDNSGQRSEDHFIGGSKMVRVGSGAKRAIEDVSAHAICLLLDCPERRPGQGAHRVCSNLLSQFKRARWR